MHILTPLATLSFAAAPLLAQELERPADWQVRFDRPTSDSVYFVTMTPGWHLTTGPSAIFYNPSTTAAGEYRVSSEIYLFPGDRREGFGLFIGGTDLEGEGQSYLYFLIRKDGRYIVKRRNGVETPTITPWTEHPAIVRQSGDQQAKNVLEIDVGPERLTFYVNGETVTSIPRGALLTDGVVGLRVNHNLNLHVTSLTITR
ncbi:MAG: hypothetical protein JSW71_12840 [Gemmatimonadota bacterium]|nr:MAG: hypothetical protein JSW71_12840 [Gemmatimonadota bacterium]